MTLSELGFMIIKLRSTRNRLAVIIHPLNPSEVGRHLSRPSVACQTMESRAVPHGSGCLHHPEPEWLQQVAVVDLLLP
jgi:hypothetical protein